MTIAHLNVEKIGRFKRKELADILSKYDIDCLGIVEHQLGLVTTMKIRSQPGLDINPYK